MSHLALGEIALAVGKNIKPYLDSVMATLLVGITEKKKGSKSKCCFSVRAGIVCKYLYISVHMGEGKVTAVLVFCVCGMKCAYVCYYLLTHVIDLNACARLSSVPMPVF